MYAVKEEFFFDCTRMAGGDPDLFSPALEILAGTNEIQIRDDRVYLTRGKHLVIIVGSSRIVHTAFDNNRTNLRR